MDISKITDIKELKVIMADEFVKRENALAAERQASAGIRLLQQRIAQLEAEKKPVVDDKKN